MSELLSKIMQKKLSFLRRPDLVLFILFSYVLAFHLVQEKNVVSESLIPEQIYRFNIAMFFEPEDEVEISTFLPLSNNRQEIIDELISNKNLQFEDKSNIDGRYVSWRGSQDSNYISYSALLSLQAVQYQLSNELTLGSINTPYRLIIFT